MENGRSVWLSLSATSLALGRLLCAREVPCTWPSFPGCCEDQSLSRHGSTSRCCPSGCACSQVCAVAPASQSEHQDCKEGGKLAQPLPLGRGARMGSSRKSLPPASLPSVIRGGEELRPSSFRGHGYFRFSKPSSRSAQTFPCAGITCRSYLGRFGGAAWRPAFLAARQCCC